MEQLLGCTKLICGLSDSTLTQKLTRQHITFHITYHLTYFTMKSKFLDNETFKSVRSIAVDDGTTELLNQAMAEGLKLVLLPELLPLELVVTPISELILPYTIYKCWFHV